MPSAIEKQRTLYNDPFSNSSGFLMHDRKNEPLNYLDFKQIP
jgi:hypothetical protein